MANDNLKEALHSLIRERANWAAKHREVMERIEQLDTAIDSLRNLMGIPVEKKVISRNTNVDFLNPAPHASRLNLEIRELLRKGTVYTIEGLISLLTPEVRDEIPTVEIKSKVASILSYFKTMGWVTQPTKGKFQIIEKYRYAQTRLAEAAEEGKIEARQVGDVKIYKLG